MKKVILSIVVIAGLLMLNACGEKKDESKKNDAESTEESETEETDEQDETEETETTETVECEGPMMDFIGMFKGSYTDVEAALNQYGKEGLDRADMDLYDLQEPKVIACSKSETGECCTLEAKAGMTIRTYDICWEGDKIVAIVDKGMR